MCPSTNALEERRGYREPEGEQQHVNFGISSSRRLEIALLAFSPRRATKRELTHNDRTNFFADL